MCHRGLLTGPALPNTIKKCFVKDRSQVVDLPARRPVWSARFVSYFLYLRNGVCQLYLRDVDSRVHTPLWAHLHDAVLLA